MQDARKTAPPTIGRADLLGGGGGKEELHRSGLHTCPFPVPPLQLVSPPPQARGYSTGNWAPDPIPCPLHTPFLSVTPFRLWQSRPERSPSPPTPSPPWKQLWWAESGQPSMPHPRKKFSPIFLTLNNPYCGLEPPPRMHTLQYPLYTAVSPRSWRNRRRANSKPQSKQAWLTHIQAELMLVYDTDTGYFVIQKQTIKQKKQQQWVDRIHFPTIKSCMSCMHHSARQRRWGRQAVTSRCSQLGRMRGWGGGCLPLYAAKIVLRTLTCGDREGVGIVREPNTHWL